MNIFTKMLSIESFKREKDSKNYISRFLRYADAPDDFMNNLVDAINDNDNKKVNKLLWDLPGYYEYIAAFANESELLNYHISWVNLCFSQLDKIEARPEIKEIIMDIYSVIEFNLFKTSNILSEKCGKELMLEFSPTFEYLDKQYKEYKKNIDRVIDPDAGLSGGPQDYHGGYFIP